MELRLLMGKSLTSLLRYRNISAWIAPGNYATIIIIIKIIKPLFNEGKH